MTEEEYIRKRMDMINQNSVYGLMSANSSEIANIVHSYIVSGINCDYDRLNCPKPPIHIRPVKVKTLKERLEGAMMKATSVQNIKNVKDISFTIINDPIEMESKLTIVATTDDDIFAFEFEGPDMLQNCKKSGLFTGWEKDQKIKELEEELGRWKKEAADCLKLRDEARKEKQEMKKEYEKKLDNIQCKFERSLIEKQKILDTNRKLQEKIFHLEELKTPTIENFTDEEPGDNVNHPSHYETGKFECIEVMQEIFGVDAIRDFCKCNAFKYVYRMDRKNGTEDVKKAIWYLKKYLELTEKEE